MWVPASSQLLTGGGVLPKGRGAGIHPGSLPHLTILRMVQLLGNHILFSRGNLKPQAWEVKMTQGVRAESHRKRKLDTWKVKQSLSPKGSP